MFARALRTRGHRLQRVKASAALGRYSGAAGVTSGQTVKPCAARQVFRYERSAVATRVGGPFSRAVALSPL